MQAAPRVACLALLVVLAAGASACPKREEADARKALPPLDPVQKVYAEGRYADALPLLEKQLETDRNGTVLYQIGYAKGVLEGKSGTSKLKLWGEAKPLLETEIAKPGGATLDRLYYLTAISSEQGEVEQMKKFARQAIDTIEKGPDPNGLTGEDWFRLARMHEFLNEASEAEAAYRRSVSAFQKTPARITAYQALALIRVADLDYDTRRFEQAAEGYEESLKLAPNLGQVSAFRRGTAQLAAGRIDDAIKAFSADTDGETNTESQYAADLARKIKDAGGLAKSDADGVPIDKMPLDNLDPRIKKAADDYRAARQKFSFRNGDALSAELADRQKRFASLLRERFLQTGELQEYCLKEGLADLVRR